MPKPFSEAAVNQITERIIGAAIRIHRALRPGLLENAYFACLCLDLTKASVRFESQKALPLLYDGVRIECAYRVDLIVEELVASKQKRSTSWSRCICASSAPTRARPIARLACS